MSVEPHVHRAPVWRWPIVIALLTAAGLGLALAGTGVVRMLAWVGLTLPIVITAYFVHRE